MVTEDYVSFETAKLLKKNGFDEPTGYYFNENGVVLSCGITHINNDNPLQTTTSRPTLQMAMKWLREIHYIHIQVLRYPAKVKIEADRLEYSKPWFYQYTRLTELEDIDTDFFGEEEFETSEDAIDGGIKYCLENLI